MQVCIGLGSCFQVYDMSGLHAASCKCTLAVAVACKCTICLVCMLPHASVHWPWLSLASVRYVGCAWRLMQVWTVDVAAGCKCPLHGCSCRLQVCYGCGFRLQVHKKWLPATNADGLCPCYAIVAVDFAINCTFNRLTWLMAANGLCKLSAHTLSFALLVAQKSGCWLSRGVVNIGIGPLAFVNSTHWVIMSGSTK